jgi:hypothetical protein
MTFDKGYQEVCKWMEKGTDAIEHAGTRGGDGVPEEDCRGLIVERLD